MRLSASLILLAHFVGSNAFALLPTRATQTSRVFMSEPSDTSSDSYDDDFAVTVESEPYEPTTEDVLVSNVMDMIPATLGDVSPEVRSAINEAIYKLEAANPTPEPTLSSLLAGFVFMH